MCVCACVRACVCVGVTTLSLVLISPYIWSMPFTTILTHLNLTIHPYLYLAFYHSLRHLNLTIYHNVHPYRSTSFTELRALLWLCRREYPMVTHHSITHRISGSLDQECQILLNPLGDLSGNPDRVGHTTLII